MLIAVESRDRTHYLSEIRSYYRLRKLVFADQLGWEVPCFGDEERDELDENACTYILKVGDDGEVEAGARLIPTTRKTLLEHAFPDLVPEWNEFVSPTIIESSRYCVRPQSSAERVRAGVRRNAVELSLASLEYAHANGYTHIIAVVEERLYSLTKNFTASADIVGEKLINGEKVLCAIWPVDPVMLSTVRNLRAQMTG